MPLRLTPQMKQRLTRRTLEMVQRALGYFPELQDAAITIGYTREHLGSATVIYRKGELYRLIPRLRVRRVTYHTIGHELTFLVRPRTATAALAAQTCPIPVGETQCDIWTQPATQFPDDPPTYIKCRIMREAGRITPSGARAVHRRHCETADAATIYPGLEKEIIKLAKAPQREKTTGPAQLFLPFVI